MDGFSATQRIPRAIEGNAGSWSFLGGGKSTGHVDALSHAEYPDQNEEAIKDGNRDYVAALYLDFEFSGPHHLI